MLKRLLLAAALVAVPAVAGCSANSSDGKPKAVAAFYPLQFMTEQIAGDHFDVENLTNPGTEPHDMTLTVRQTADVVDADVVVYLKGFQAPVDDAVAQSASDHIVDVSGDVDLLPARENPDEMDPHFWLDPVRFSQAAPAVEAALAAADPEHADEYAANLKTFQARLAKIDADYKAGLASCRIDAIVVSHDAFNYLSQRYGLTSFYINGLSPEAEPSPKHIAELHDLIKQHGITTVFSETLASPAMADALSQDLGLRSEVLDPIGGLASDSSGENYFTIMEQNLKTLREANDCR